MRRADTENLDSALDSAGGGAAAADVQLVRDFLRDDNVREALGRYRRVRASVPEHDPIARPLPATVDAAGIAQRSVAWLNSDAMEKSQDATQMRKIVGSPHFQAALRLHDRIATSRFGSTAADAQTAGAATASAAAAAGPAAVIATSPAEAGTGRPQANALAQPAAKVVPPAPAELAAATASEAEAVVVQLEKPSGGTLGATVTTNDAGRVVIGRVMHNSAAARTGLLHAGDLVRSAQLLAAA